MSSSAELYGGPDVEDDVENVDEFEEEETEEIDKTDFALKDQDVTFKRLNAAHPELVQDYVETVLPKLPLKVFPAGPFTDAGNGDENHRTYPFLTKYERTRIIGQRANELSLGARAYIQVPEHVTDVREIARLELDQKRLPYIVKRPLPNGQYEYWRLSDLMILPN
jgi:DNA-directed RNA polymerases I, II, and III subunit RPABC2